MLCYYQCTREQLTFTQHNRNQNSHYINYTVSQKHEPTLASCSFIKYGLILIILGKQCQYTFDNYMHIQLSSSLHFCLIYLLLSNCDRNDEKHNALSSVDCSWLSKEPVPLKKAGLISADVQWCPFTFTHAHSHFFPLTFYIEDILWYVSLGVNEVLLQITSVASFPSQLFKSK